MYYFLNTTIPLNKSGIEHAQIKRVNLFNNYGVANKIVTRNFEVDLHHNLKVAGIAEKNHVNLFEFLQGSGDFKFKKVTPRDIKLPHGCKLKAEKDHYVAKDLKNRLAVRIEVWGEHDSQVQAVNYYDYAGNLLRRERYDHRGFLSIAEIHNPQGGVSNEQIFSPEGKLVYESFYFKDGQGKIVNSLLRVVDFHGQNYEFTGLRGLQRFFFDQLNKVDNGRNVFISDRAVETEWALLHMKTPAYKALFLHNAHTAHANDPMDPVLNNNFEFSLNNFADWNAVIDSTERQTKDAKLRFDAKQTPIYTIPVGIVTNELMEKPKVAFSDRTPGKIIVVARLFPEKRLDHLIKAFAIVHKQLPQTTLDFWGYGDGKTDKQLKQQVTDLKLKTVVKFKGYTPNIGDVMDHAQVSTLTSNVEGFALAVLEAQSHGLPVVAYDIPYGPSDIIEDGYSGTLVKQGDYKSFAKALIELLGDQKKLQEYSDHAYVSRERYSEKAIWKAWQQLVDNANQFFDQNQAKGTVK
ncbi:glycosyltransferase family 4 protein [Pediococcus damnosus]|uniref:Poly(Glycerol-phosphate) alpha-glucosyltransferase n=1 Tax=Pediococcus damnosus TaxID=51663 RepID=A0AAC9FJG3_9LACO|nr:glycosyltransferase [Pediococcus damnosus]AMV60887.1 Poly(glycerol-phosphate) alpha-glucosyltransferase [Pediococcus damnosus]AMV63453.1 Poly(glycerol-phosphate) alpha-glucosyltransferase [Pediococcus damnosus]AMV65246.1 Poly(glycerol-phosphate) alpha-glucosyltransferase [Pediococcus damnosus]AMV68901.1 Poly(glycerol-phosphate) alpha-glucosyltransferase [Pediococcus damnosus]KJU73375.1 poly(glycerol-phosphate) alpha-glucosyltransferase [Pediococcus damnosus LMG 28219]